ncbi:MAG: threonine/serine exporter family protein [Anaerolineae bacterium]|nr:threonine/serine exporter family protein [Anaerolineae bacterium]
MSMTASDAAKLTATETTETASAAHAPLSHGELADVLRVVMRFGVMMLQSGSTSFRVEEAMARLAAALRVDRLEAYVTPTGLIASAYSDREHRTQIMRIRNLGVDMNRLVVLELLSRNLPPGSTAADTEHRLDDIEKQGVLYSRGFIVASVALACGALALVLGGSVLDFFAAALGSGVAMFVRGSLGRRGFSPLPSTVVSAAVATAITLAMGALFTQIGPALGIPNVPPLAVIASVLLLVPGVPLVAALVDLTHLDLVSGTVRAAYAALLIVCIALGVLAVLALTDVNLLGTTPLRGPEGLALPVALQLVYGFVITAGFGVLFNLPRYTLARTGLVGAVALAARFLGTHAGASPVTATFVAALVVGLVGYGQSRVFHIPRTVFTVTGIIGLVPGVAGFETLIFFQTGDILGGLQSFVTASLITGAIAAGLGTARILLDMEWRYSR